jgi:hypothetical protein
MITAIVIASCFLTSCHKEDNAYNSQDILDNSSLEIEEYIIAGLDYQHALNIFNNEIKNIDFSKLTTYQDSKGNTIVNIPTSVCIEEKVKIFNKKKKLLLDKCPQIVSISSDTRRSYIQKCLQNSSKVNEKALELGININQLRLKGFTYEMYSNNNHCAYLDDQLSSNNSNYVEIILIVFENGRSMTYIDSSFTSSTCFYPPLYKNNTTNKWYTSLYNSSPIDYIAHTHRGSSEPSSDDYDYNYPGLRQGIYTSGCNVNIYQQ